MGKILKQIFHYVKQNIILTEHLLGKKDAPQTIPRLTQRELAFVVENSRDLNRVIGGGWRFEVGR